MLTFTLDESQRAALSTALAGANVRVFGAPGTGKTSVAMEIAAELIAARGEGAARIVTPSRAAATRIRDDIGLRVGVATRGPLARSISALAFDIVSASSPTGVPPRLLSGGQQDADIKDLLADEIARGADGYWPESLPPEVRSLREFRTQLRDLLSRARDAELVDESAEEPLAAFAQLATTHRRVEWIAAARFFESYLRNMSDSRAGQIDPTELLHRATQLVRESSTTTRQTLIVDDAHDLTPSQWRFVAAWARHRGQVIVFGDPQLATTGFRGGSAVFLRDDDGLEWANPVTLTTIHRQSGAAPTLLRTVSQAIGGGVPSVINSYPKPLAPEEARQADGTRFLSAMAASPAHEREIVARFLRDAVVNGTPLERIAVVVRSGSLAESMVTSLSASSIPAYAETTGSPLRDHPAVWSLLQLANVGTGREELTVETARDLLLGPFGRLTTLDYRRFRRNLRKAEITAGGNRLADALMLEALTQLGAFETEVQFSAPGVRWIIETLRAVREAHDWQIDELLWLIWNRSNRATVWAQETLGTGPVAVKAHESLDAVMALFDVAATSLDNVPSESSTVFLDRMLDQTVPNDSLSPRATAGAVLVCTPAALVGREFDVTVIAGLNEGVWPNTRARSALLKAHELTLVHEGIDLTTLDLRKAVLFDELRLFLVAASRATMKTLVTAINSEDETPSALFRMVAGEKESTDKSPRSVPAANALGTVFLSERIDANIGEMVGRLRHVLIADGEWVDGVHRRFSPTDKARAAAALKELALRKVRGADPSAWLGYVPRDAHPLFADGEVRISPSGMESFDDNAIDWFISQVSGSSSGASTIIGTLVHRALELYPSGVADDLWSVIEERWHEINFDADWERSQWLRITRAIVENIARYVVDSGNKHVAHELRTTVELTSPDSRVHITISGSLDRLDETAEGNLIVLDLKTGKTAITQPKTDEHLQLKSYQLALAKDELLPAILAGRKLESAALLYPRAKDQKNKKPYKLLVQKAMDDDAMRAFVDQVIAMGELMSQSSFTGKREATQYGADLDLDTRWARVPEVSANE